MRMSEEGELLTRQSLLFYGHIHREAIEYRTRYAQIWGQHPQLNLPRVDLTLPSDTTRVLMAAGDRIPEEDPPLLDVICSTIGKGDRWLTLLFPPWSGKTSIAAAIIGLGLPSFPKRLSSKELLSSPLALDLQRTGFQLFNSDFAWMASLGGRLALLRPRGELPIWLWDLARSICREALGPERFLAERVLPLEERTQFEIYIRLNPGPLQGLLSRADHCYPEALLLLKLKRSEQGSPNKVGLKWLEPNEIEGALTKALEENTIFTGTFWRRDPDKVRGRINSIIDSLKGSNWPKVAQLVIRGEEKGRLPREEMAYLIAQILR